MDKKIESAVMEWEMWEFRKARISSPGYDITGVRSNGHNPAALDHCIDKCDALEEELKTLYRRRDKIEGIIKRELSKLSPDEYAVMMDRYVINTSTTHEETARRLGWSERQVRNLHEQALKKIHTKKLPKD